MSRIFLRWSFTDSSVSGFVQAGRISDFLRRGNPDEGSVIIFDDASRFISTLQRLQLLLGQRRRLVGCLLGLLDGDLLGSRLLGSRLLGSGLAVGDLASSTFDLIGEVFLLGVNNLFAFHAAEFADLEVERSRDLAVISLEASLDFGDEFSNVRGHIDYDKFYHKFSHL